MKTRGILFSTEMVKAILEGRKTQTRREVKEAIGWDQSFRVVPIKEEHKDGIQRYEMRSGTLYSLPWFKCPYGQVGDVLYVRETWQHTRELNINPEDENYGYVYKADDQPWKDIEGWKWKPSLFMPKEAARIFLRIKLIRVERLQDISENDAVAEGIDFVEFEDESIVSFPVNAYANLWDSINGNGSWKNNPWVWVIEFEMISKEEAYA